MRRLRIFSIILLIVSVVACVGYELKWSKGADKLGPQISMDESSISVSVKATDQELMQGVTAVDAKDGDVTDSIVIENVSTFLEKGRRLISYVAFDSDNHVTKAFRQIVYTDYTSPKFELTEPLCFVVGTEDIMEGMRARDCIDGDISDKIKISSDSVIYTGVAGEYSIKLQVTNSCGDMVTLPVTVEMCERSDYVSRPQIGLSDYIVYTERGNKLDPASYLEKVMIGEQEYALTDESETYGAEEDQGYHTVNRSRIEISDKVNYNKAGVYEITYAMSSLEGSKGKTRLIVVVEDSESKDTETEAAAETKETQETETADTEAAATETGETESENESTSQSEGEEA